MLAIPFPAIDPIAFAIGPFAIRWYALAYVVGLLGGWAIARRLAASERLWTPLRAPTGPEIDDLVVWVALGVVLGGRLGYVLFYNFSTYLARPAEIFAVWHGGMSFHGGFLGAVLALTLFARAKGLNPLAVLDMAAVVTPIGLFLGRIANFVNGELWGRPAPGPAPRGGVPACGGGAAPPEPALRGLRRGARAVRRPRLAVRRFGFRRPGIVGGLFVAGYAVARIVCEFFREPDAQLGFLLGTSVDILRGGLTMGMLLSIPMLVFGIGLVAVARRGLTRPTAEPRSA
jgi:phosphatidylglycerol:prolipoprotein diacylglycerol transferase